MPKQDDINWSDYDRLAKELREANARGDWKRADELTPIVSELAEEIARNQNLPGRRPDNPKTTREEQAWNELRRAQEAGDTAAIKRLKEETRHLAASIEKNSGPESKN